MTPPPPPRTTEGSESPEPGRRVSRKTVLKAALVAGTVPLLTSGGTALARDLAAQGAPLTPTPTCDDGDDPTPPQMEGPYFKPNSPLRTNLAPPGTPGIPLTVRGYVFGRNCKPFPGVLLDFWQADVNGTYDLAGYAFRGHQFTDSTGAFALTTIVPGLYPGRTRHLHVKAQAPGRSVLTTQLYFPNEPRNNTDALFDPVLLMTVQDNGSNRQATFDFVLNAEPGPDPGNPPSGTWKSGTSYKAGDEVTYNGVTYRCLQAHTAAPGWDPPNAPALWQRR